MPPSFPTHISVPVSNYLTGQPYLLKRMDEVPGTPAIYEQVIAICNEPDVYRWLFRDRLASQPYGVDMARQFFELGLQGWKTNASFIFLLLTLSGTLAAAADIKSADTDGAEIGYWASATHRGTMTNATKALLELAALAGYRSLWARVKKANANSARVLQRSGFTADPSQSQGDETYDFYRVELGSSCHA